MSPIRILHVEDDRDDAFFFSRSIKRAKLGCELHREINGEGAIDFLSKAGAESKTSSPLIPDLMVLDLKLPGLSGFDVLSWMQQQPALKKLPVIVLSGSSLAQDQNRAVELGAAEFIVKQGDYDLIAAQVVEFLVKTGPQKLNTDSPTI